MKLESKIVALRPVEVVSTDYALQEYGLTPEEMAMAEKRIGAELHSPMNANGASLRLDTATAHLVDALTQTWGVSKEEAVRRAVAQTQAAPDTLTKQGRLEAFKELQRRLGLSPAKAADWQNTVYDARR